MLRFDDRVVLISGAARGLGRAYAETLAERGARVVVNDLGGDVDGAGENVGPADDVVNGITAAGGVAIANYADISKPEGAAAAVRAATETFGRLDVVINNAGIFNPRDLQRTDADHLRRHLEAHIVGPFNLTLAAWPHLTASASPRVIFVTSLSVFGSPGYVSYATAKSAVIGLTMNLAVAGEDSGVLVNAVSPVADTRMALAGGVTQEQMDSLDPIEKRRRHPDRVAPLVALLAHQSWSKTGRIYEAGHGRFAELFLAECQGYINVDATMEDVDEHWSTIEDRTDFWVPDKASSSLPLRRVLEVTGW